MSHEEEKRRLEKVGNQVSETTQRLLWRPTGDHKDPSQHGKKKEALPLQG